jgi:hypothetical protein
MNANFIAKTRKQGGSIVISVPSNLNLEENKVYQFSVNKQVIE